MSSASSRVIRDDGLLGRKTKDGQQVVTDEGSTERFDPKRWKVVLPPHRREKADLVRIAFEADRELCRLLGLNDKAAKDWQSLSADERSRWILVGPTEPPVRRRLYLATLAALEPLREPADPS